MSLATWAYSYQSLNDKIKIHTYLDVRSILYLVYENIYLVFIFISVSYIEKL